MTDGLSAWDALAELGVEPASPGRVAENRAVFAEALAEMHRELYGDSAAETLDVVALGCGDGSVAAALADEIAVPVHVLGFELSPEQATAAKAVAEGHDSFTAVAGDGVQFLSQLSRGADAGVDAVLAINVLQGLRLEPVADALAAAVRPGGRVLATYPADTDVLRTGWDDEHDRPKAELPLRHDLLDEAVADYDGFMQGEGEVLFEQWYVPPERARSAFEDSGFAVETERSLPVGDGNFELAGRILRASDVEVKSMPSGDGDLTVRYLVARRTA